MKALSLLFLAALLPAQSVEKAHEELDRLSREEEPRQQAPAAVKEPAPAAKRAAAPTPQIKAKPSRLKPVLLTWTFETGDLRGWTKAGGAFDGQPRRGPKADAEGRTLSDHKGDYWIATADGPVGSLLSEPFLIASPAVQFLVGGGCDPDLVRVELLIDGKEVHRATGKCSEALDRQRWSLEAFAGKKARFRLVDESSADWGRLYFDDIFFEE